jgi:excisionase family DNA binding protein
VLAENTSTLLGIDQVSSQLNISKSFARQLVREGKLKGIKLGTRTLVPATDLIAFIAAAPAVEVK